MSNSIKQLKLDLKVGSLLTVERANPKVAKSEKLGISTGVLHLSPADSSGYEVCPMRSDGCTAACLHTAGNPAYLQNKIESRKRRTVAFFENREKFMNLLVLEMSSHIRRAEEAKFEPAFRLNGTSDIRWETIRFEPYEWVRDRTGILGGHGTIFEHFFDCQFYDYTKLHNRKKIPENYHLTFSLNETNREFATQQPFNIAVVFKGKPPKEYLGRPVIDGDEHDYRPQDPEGVVVGLKVKGRGRQDTTGFVVQL